MCRNILIPIIFSVKKLLSYPLYETSLLIVSVVKERKTRKPKDLEQKQKHRHTSLDQYNSVLTTVNLGHVGVRKEE